MYIPCNYLQLSTHAHVRMCELALLFKCLKATEHGVVPLPASSCFMLSLTQRCEKMWKRWTWGSVGVKMPGCFQVIQVGDNRNPRGAMMQVVVVVAAFTTSSNKLQSCLEMGETMQWPLFTDFKGALVMCTSCTIVCARSLDKFGWILETRLIILIEDFCRCQRFYGMKSEEVWQIHPKTMIGFPSLPSRILTFCAPYLQLCSFAEKMPLPEKFHAHLSIVLALAVHFEGCLHG